MNIIIWSGSAAEIPTGWELCDGGGGRPDLRDRFIRCSYSDATRSPGSTGGSNTHDHGSMGTSHTHSTASRSLGGHVYGTASFGHLSQVSSGWRTDGHSHSHGSSSSESHSHTTGSGSSVPTYYKLCFICTSERVDAPTGTVIMWSGNIEDIHSGWKFCNGDGETYDLRDKMIKEGTPGTTGGGSHSHSSGIDGSHSHSSGSGDDGHTHTSTGSGGTWEQSFGTTGGNNHTSSVGGSHTHTLSTAGSHNHSRSSSVLPPYYTLAFIQKT